MKKTALVVMAAGMGSRFGGLKQVEPIGPKGEAILDFSAYDAKKAGFDEVIFVIKHEIENDFKSIVGQRIEKILPVKYVFQETDKLPEGIKPNAGRKKPWGTGHAILCCKDVVKVPFAVINADDFYGASAFEKIHNALINGENYCMVGYLLKNTVTENGDVSRGVCTVENGKLKDINEHTKIDSNCRFTKADGTVEQLAPDTVVSMNMWGFTPDIFEYLESDFRTFLKDNLDSEKAEFYLPAVVDRLIKTGRKEADVLVAEEKWYGVTYREDKQTVVNAVNALIKAGKYGNL